MNPVTPNREPKPSSQPRKVVTGGSLNPLSLPLSGSAHGDLMLKIADAEHPRKASGLARWPFCPRQCSPGRYERMT